MHTVLICTPHTMELFSQLPIYRDSVWDTLVKNLEEIDPSSQSRKLRAAKVACNLQQQRDSFKPNNITTNNCTDLGRCLPFLRQPELSDELKFAEKAGFKMIPNFFFPAIPSVLEDFWVALELIVVLFDFIFNCVVFSPTPLDIFVVSLSIVAVVLALIDSLLYFANESYCKSLLLKICNYKQRKSKSVSSRKRFCRFRAAEQIKKKLGIWFQVIRTVLSELILFPLTLADLIELIELRTYNGTDAENRINFGLFIMSLFFLILTVYFMRIFMAFSSIANVKKLRKTTSNDPSAYIIKFCTHLIAQVVMHATIFLMISSKLNQETCTANSNMTSGNNTDTTITISPFLWYEMSSGSFIPLAAIFLFFLINYPALRQLSVTMYIDIMSSVINESFADLVFQGEGLKTAKKKASKVAEKAKLTTTKDDFEKQKKMHNFANRLQYQLTNPLVIASCLAYSYIFIAFFITHCFGYENPCNIDSGFKFLLFKDNFVTVTFFIGILTALASNYQILFVAGTLFISGTLAIFTLPLVIVFVPIYLILKRCNNHS